LAGRLSTAIEAGLILTLALLAIFWIIPAQTDGDGNGLRAADLPTACAVIIALLVLADSVLRFVDSPAPSIERGQAGSSRVVSGAILVCILAAVAVQFLGVAATSAIMIAALMILLGERSVLRVVLTTVTTTLVIASALRWIG